MTNGQSGPIWVDVFYSPDLRNLKEPAEVQTEEHDKGRGPYKEAGRGWVQTKTSAWRRGEHRQLEG